MMALCAKRDHDHFSKSVIVYAAIFFASYSALFQLSYNNGLSSLSFWSWALIAVHAVAFFWCIGTCLLLFMPRQFASFVCAAALVIGLQLSYPNPLMVHFWLHKSEYLARVSAAARSSDGHLSIVVYSYGTYYPGLGGMGSMCSTEIVYDNSNDISLVAHTEAGHGSAKKIDGNFYLRWPPC